MNQCRSGGDEAAAQHECADDAEKQHAVLAGGRYSERRKSTAKMKRLSTLSAFSTRYAAKYSWPAAAALRRGDHEPEGDSRADPRGADQHRA